MKTTKRKPVAPFTPNKNRREQARAYLAFLPGGVPRPEYPRPQFVRRDWLCLNGEWEFYRDPYDQGLAARWPERALPDFIIVPFAMQSALSCRESREICEVVWYARDFEIPAHWLVDEAREANDVLLHFGACDYRTTVWVNDEEVGHNQGGHVPFAFDIAPLLKAGTNRVCVRVEDLQNPRQPRGKQAVGGVASGIDYTGTTGIWQSVWLEPVPTVRIQELQITPIAGANPGDDALEIRVALHAPAVGWHLQAEAFVDESFETLVASTENDAAGAVARLRLPLPNAKRWSPDAPHLYGLRVRLLKDGQVLDEVESYAGVRSVGLRDGQFWLNGKPLYLQMVLDQGYWPDGGMTAPSDEALRADVEWCKKFGFNGARKHQKVEDPRWLYHCDKLGLLVWGEMANARAWSADAEERFLAEWERAVRRDFNHPCIVTWVPINESWGVPELREGHLAQHAFLERAVALTRRLDETRPIVDNDGWEHTDVADILAIHDYTPSSEKLRKRYAQALQGGALPAKAWGNNHRQIHVRDARHRGQPVMLTEIGGFLNLPDLPREKWDALYHVYASCRTPQELLAKYRDLMEGIAALPFVTGWCYTQLTDIEQEINGLLTFNRESKIEPEHIAAIHRELFDEADAGGPWQRLQQWRASLDGGAKR